MDKKKAFELAKALESGKYKQGNGYLRTFDNRFCCLGVACMLIKVKWEKRYGVYQTDGESVALSSSNSSLTGIYTPYGHFKKPIKCVKNKKSIKIESLANLNDGGFSFKFIAKILRKHYKNII